MLPDFKRVKDYANRSLIQWAHRQVPTVAPLLQEVATFHQHEGKDFSVVRQDRPENSTGYRSVQAELPMTREEMKNCDLNALRKKLVEAANQIGRAQTQHMLEVAGKAADSVGNVVHADGELTPEKFLELFRGVEMDFDPQTLEPKSIIVMHPKAAEILVPKVKEWEKDPKFIAEHERIMTVKRREWRDREANRKLVD